MEPKWAYEACDAADTTLWPIKPTRLAKSLLKLI
jgi:hypothetical protein